MNDIIKVFKISMMNVIIYQTKYIYIYKCHQKFKPKNWKLKDYDYDEWFTEDQLDDEEELDDKKVMKN